LKPEAVLLAATDVAFWDELRRKVNQRLGPSPEESAYRHRWKEIRAQTAKKRPELLGPALTVEVNRRFWREIEAKIGRRLDPRSKEDAPYRERWREIRDAIRASGGPSLVDTSMASEIAQRHAQPPIDIQVGSQLKIVAEDIRVAAVRIGTDLKCATKSLVEEEVPPTSGVEVGHGFLREAKTAVGLVDTLATLLSGFRSAKEVPGLSTIANALELVTALTNPAGFFGSDADNRKQAEFNYALFRAPLALGGTELVLRLDRHRETFLSRLIGMVKASRVTDALSSVAGIVSAVFLPIAGYAKIAYAVLKAATFALNPSKFVSETVEMFRFISKLPDRIKKGTQWVGQKALDAGRWAGNRAVSLVMRHRKSLARGTKIAANATEWASIGALGGAIALAGVSLIPGVGIVTGPMAAALLLGSSAAGATSVALESVHASLVALGLLDGSSTVEEVDEACEEAIFSLATLGLGKGAGKGIRKFMPKKLGKFPLRTYASEVGDWAVGTAAKATRASVADTYRWTKQRVSNTWAGAKLGVGRAAGLGLGAATSLYHWTRQRATAAWDTSKALAGRAVEFGQETTTRAYRWAENKAVGAWEATSSAARAGWRRINGAVRTGILAGNIVGQSLAPVFRSELSNGSYRDGDLTGPFHADGTMSHSRGDREPLRAIGSGATIFINGILNTYQNHVEAAGRLATESGRNVVGVYVASARTTLPTGAEGVLGVAQSAVGILNVVGAGLRDVFDSFNIGFRRTPTAAVRRVESLITQFGNPKKQDGGLHMVAHSKGSIVLAEALWRAQQRGVDLKRIDVETFGNAAFSFPKGANYRHYVHSGDLVSRLFGTTSPMASLYFGRHLGIARKLTREFGRGGDADDARRSTVVVSQRQRHPFDVTPHNFSPDPRLARESNSKRTYLDDLYRFRSLHSMGATGVPRRISLWDPVSMALHAAGAGLTAATAIGQGFVSVLRGAGNAPASGTDPVPPLDSRPLSPRGERIQRRGTGPDPMADATGLHADLLAAGGAGAPVDTNLRDRLAPHLGFDPTGARLHTGPAAAMAARELGAEAFAIGPDVFFGEGNFQPHSRAGLGLIAHELTHVGQQTGVRGHAARFYSARGGDEMEVEAQRTERLVENYLSSSPDAFPSSSIDCEYLAAKALSHSETARLDRLAILAWGRASRLMKEESLHGDIDELHVNLDLDLDSMADDAIVRLWGDAIYEAAAGQLAQANGPSTPTVQMLRKGKKDPRVEEPDRGVSYELADAPTGNSSRERVQGWLEGHQQEIARLERERQVDRRAIAGVIAWEALVNVRPGGWARSLVIPGPGKMHLVNKDASLPSLPRDLELGGYLGEDKKGMWAATAYLQRRSEVATAAGAMKYIAAAMQAFSDIGSQTKDSMGRPYYLNTVPALLGNYWQGAPTGQGSHLDRLRARFNHLEGKPREKFKIREQMGIWIVGNRDYLTNAVGPSSIVPSGKEAEYEIAPKNQVGSKGKPRNELQAEAIESRVIDPPKSPAPLDKIPTSSEFGDEGGDTWYRDRNDNLQVVDDLLDAYHLAAKDIDFASTAIPMSAASAMRALSAVREATHLWLKHEADAARPAEAVSARYLLVRIDAHLASMRRRWPKLSIESGGSASKQVNELRERFEGRAESMFSYAASLVDLGAPVYGTCASVKLEVRVPVGAGVGYFGGGLSLSASREEAVKVRASMDLLGGAQIPGLRFEGRIGGYVEAQAKTAADALSLISYGFYRRSQQSAPAWVVGGVWGGTDGVQAANKRAEKWAIRMEQQVIEGSDAYVEVGGAGGVGLSASAGGMAVDQSFQLSAGTRYDAESIRGGKGHFGPPISKAVGGPSGTLGKGVRKWKLVPISGAVDAFGLKVEIQGSSIDNPSGSKLKPTKDSLQASLILMGDLPVDKALGSGLGVAMGALIAKTNVLIRASQEQLADMKGREDGMGARRSGVVLSMLTHHSLGLSQVAGHLAKYKFDPKNAITRTLGGDLAKRATEGTRVSGKVGLELVGQLSASEGTTSGSIRLDSVQKLGIEGVGGTQQHIKAALEQKELLLGLKYDAKDKTGWSWMMKKTPELSGEDKAR
jgi:hypothetical protein